MSKKGGKEAAAAAAATESKDEWVFDSLVGFLRGPVWNVPILTFIEHKSLSEEDKKKRKTSSSLRGSGGL